MVHWKVLSDIIKDFEKRFPDWPEARVLTIAWTEYHVRDYVLMTGNYPDDKTVKSFSIEMLMHLKKNRPELFENHKTL